MKIEKVITIAGKIVEKLGQIRDIEIFSEKDSSGSIYLVIDNEVIGNISVYVDCAGNNGYISDVDVNEIF